MKPVGMRGWTRCLMSHCSKAARPATTEFRLVDRYNNVAGSFDFLVKSDAGITLGDLKTVGSRKAVSGRKPATRQLGAYAKMLGQHFGHIRIDRCVTVVSGLNAAA